MLVPSGYPQNFMGVASTSRLVTFNWDPPPILEQNGVITVYSINITVANGGETIQRSSSETSLSIDTLMPFTTYFCIIAASTSVSIEPFSMVFTLKT